MDITQIRMEYVLRTRGGKEHIYVTLYVTHKDGTVFAIGETRVDTQNIIFELVDPIPEDGEEN